MEENNLNDIEQPEEEKRHRKGKKEKKEKKKSSLFDKILSLIILVVCTVGLLYSGSKLYKWLLNNVKSNQIITQINDIAGVQKPTKDEDPSASFGLNFESLIAYNSDIVGWIKVPRTSISYALVQAEDNNKYLRHSLNLAWNEFGWPFMDYRNAPDFTDKNTVLYGHNIVSGLMFADLLYIYNGVLGNDVDIDIYKPDYRILKYKVFSAYVIDPEAYFLTTSFRNKEEYEKYLDTMLSRSVIDFGQTVTTDDSIITLQTCTSDAKRRVVIHAKLVGNTEMPR